jgi:hypothetical protein
MKSIAIWKYYYQKKVIVYISDGIGINKNLIEEFRYKRRNPFSNRDLDSKVVDLIQDKKRNQSIRTKPRNELLFH